MRKKKGILVGSDQELEWLLPWWWKNYHRHNDLPVSFVDFGMSEKARLWCQVRGNLISLIDLELPIVPKEKISAGCIQQWEEHYGKTLWRARQTWFKKPFALLQTPYDRTVWLDIDCEVLGPLNALFSHVDESYPLALAKETTANVYNSGVILYLRNNSFITVWAEESRKQNRRFSGDQQLLSHLIAISQFSVKELPAEYNWRMSQGLNLHALIVHWVGAWGKEYIRKYGGISEQFSEPYIQELKRLFPRNNF